MVESLLPELETLLNERFAHLARRMPGPVPPHDVQFSKRITTSWALIYYQRNVVRLSPYLFLLEPHELKHGSYWAELDATLRHEVVHAYLYARDGTRNHTPEFQRLLEGLGVEPNGACDRGPVNRAYRFVYACPACERTWHRRTRLTGNWSCGRCSPGRYTPERRLVLARTLAHPWERLRAARERVREAVAYAREAVHADALPALPMLRG